MVLGAISYHKRSNLLQTEGNLNSIRYPVKCYSPKLFPSFKASLELSFSRIMHAYMLQRLFETFVQPNTFNFFLDLLIRRICRLVSMSKIWLVGVSLMILVLQLQKKNFVCIYKQYEMLFYKRKFKNCSTLCHVV